MNNRLTNTLLSRQWYFGIYTLGVAINLLFVAALWLHPVSRANLSPISPGKATVWTDSDAGTYIRPAEAFIVRGVFEGSDGRPDFHRTIGYPAFLALIMAMAGENWVEWLWILQSFVFGLIYPAIIVLAREWFDATQREIAFLLGGFAILGAGFVYTPIVLTDQLFCVLLWSTLASATLALRRSHPAWWIAHFITLGGAAMVRPTLALFPFAFLFMMWAMRSGHVAFARRGEIKPLFILFVFVMQTFFCQGPSIRNYINHGIWMPGDVMVDNLADYLALEALVLAGEKERAATARPQWRDLPHRERMDAQMGFTREVISAYPGWALASLAFNMICNTLETHWIQVFHFFRDSLHCDLKRWTMISTELKVFHFMWALIHAALLFAALAGLWRFLVSRRWAWIIFVGIMALPFLYGATSAQGARFRLYLEPLILMLALVAVRTSCREARHA